jgi:hypothetical protein
MRALLDFAGSNAAGHVGDAPLVGGMVVGIATRTHFRPANGNRHGMALILLVE